MSELRNLFVKLDYTDVETYIQSGNVVFTAPSPLPQDAGVSIAAAIASDLGVKATVLLRSVDQLDRILASNPFSKSDSDPKTLHVTFLEDDAVNPDTVVAPEGAGAGSDMFHILGQEVYLSCPDGYGRTKLNNTWWERKLKVCATTRNWKTVVALAAMLHA